MEEPPAPALCFLLSQGFSEEARGGLWLCFVLALKVPTLSLTSFGSRDLCSPCQEPHRVPGRGQCRPQTGDDRPRANRQWLFPLLRGGLGPHQTSQQSGFVWEAVEGLLCAPESQMPHPCTPPSAMAALLSPANPEQPPTEIRRCRRGRPRGEAGRRVQAGRSQDLQGMLGSLNPKIICAPSSETLHSVSLARQKWKHKTKFSDV